MSAEAGWWQKTQSGARGVPSAWTAPMAAISPMREAANPCTWSDSRWHDVQTATDFAPPRSVACASWHETQRMPGDREGPCADARNSSTSCA
jgi:hypothetical protein